MKKIKFQKSDLLFLFLFLINLTSAIYYGNYINGISCAWLVLVYLYVLRSRMQIEEIEEKDKEILRLNEMIIKMHGDVEEFKRSMRI